MTVLQFPDLGNRSELLSPYRFDNLTPAEKVEAVLAIVEEPVSSDMLFDVAGVDQDGLLEGEMLDILELLKRTDVTNSAIPSADTRHWIPPEQSGDRQAVFERLGLSEAGMQRVMAQWCSNNLDKMGLF